MTEENQPLKFEWSFFVDVSNITEDAEHYSISASEQEQRDLSKRLNIQSIQNLTAELDVCKSPLNGLINVTGNVEAKIIQTCVVTLDPVQDDLKAEIDGWFGKSHQVISLSKVKKDKLSKISGVELPILEESEEPEEIINGQIDLGELVTQHLSLAIDPYPHKEGVEYEHQHDNQSAHIPPTRNNPFAKLREWKDKEKDKA
jgi:hypothetical protein